VKHLFVVVVASSESKQIGQSSLIIFAFKNDNYCK
jgi:hypothetical protein